MTPDQFREAIAAIGLSPLQAAVVLGVHPVALYRYQCGMRPVPAMAQNFLRFVRAVDPDERAAILSTMLASADATAKARAKAKARPQAKAKHKAREADHAT